MTRGRCGPVAWSAGVSQAVASAFRPAVQGGDLLNGFAEDGRRLEDRALSQALRDATRAVTNVNAGSAGDRHGPAGQGPVFEFVFIVTLQFASGATAGNTPPCALGQPR